MNKKKEPIEILPIKQWWLILISGIITMASGIAVIVFDYQEYNAPVLFFGASIIIAGITHLIVSIASNNPVVNKASIFFVSFFDIILGVLITVSLFSDSFVPFCFAVWMLYHGILVIIFGKDLSKAQVPNARWNIYTGVLLIVLSFAITILSLLSYDILNVTMIGWSFVFYGWLQISMSLQLKTAHKIMKVIDSE